MKDERLLITRGTSVAPQLLLLSPRTVLLFESFQPGNVQNPSDVYLNEALLGVSFAPEIEDKDFSSQS